MAKIKTEFVCNKCAYSSSKWLGKCPQCDAWNSFSENRINKTKSKTYTGKISAQSLNHIQLKTENRILTNIQEFDQLLGGGIVASSIILLGGEPGIGKSTLLLQVAGALAKTQVKVLYLAAEESNNQIKMRATRLGIEAENLFISSSTSIDELADLIQQLQIGFIIIDSIQAVKISTIEQSPGSIIQIRESAAFLSEIAKQIGIPMIITGHITKDGMLAGPKMLEHLVDVVLYFEGTRDSNLRILRSVKNRHGDVNQIGVFLMTEKGLQEVHDPSSLYFDQISSIGLGSSLAAILDGNRVMVAEIQALVTEGPFGNIARTIEGVEVNSVLRIKAIIEKKVGIHLADKDVFINVTAGLKISDRSAELAIAVAMISSFRNIALDKKTVFIGEISLLGDIRVVESVEKRLLQLKKIGIQVVFIPSANKNKCRQITDIDIIAVDSLEEVIDIVFNK